MVEPNAPKIPEEWTQTTALAAKGDREAAKDILREFVEAVALAPSREWPSILPPQVARYIADAFTKILKDGTDASRALGLKAPTGGRPAGSRTHDEIRYAAAYWLCIRRGLRHEEANELLQYVTGAVRKTIQLARDAYPAFEDRAIDEAILLAIISEQPALSKVIPPK